MKHKSPIRCADGVELVNRFARHHATLRADNGFGMPMNTAPMSDQNRGAFSNLQDTPVAASAPVAPKVNNVAEPKKVGGAAMLGTGEFHMEGPQLHPLEMADGGFFDSVKQAIGLRPPAPPAQTRAQMNAERLRTEGGNWGNVAGSEAPASAPRGGSGASFQTARAMKELGLRDGGSQPRMPSGTGGTVPGTGTGDKIPAKYEPGEFVVSNDMLERSPGLREELRGLREQTLAEKGMTVAEADAKALGYGDQGDGHVSNRERTRAGSGGRGAESATLRTGGGARDGASPNGASTGGFRDVDEQFGAPSGGGRTHIAQHSPLREHQLTLHAGHGADISAAFEAARAKHPLGWNPAPSIAPDWSLSSDGATGRSNAIKYTPSIPQPIQATTSPGATSFSPPQQPPGRALVPSGSLRQIETYRPPTEVPGRALVPSGPLQQIAVERPTVSSQGLSSQAIGERFNPRSAFAAPDPKLDPSGRYGLPPNNVTPPSPAAPAEPFKIDSEHLSQKGKQAAAEWTKKLNTPLPSAASAPPVGNTAADQGVKAAKAAPKGMWSKATNLVSGLAEGTGNLGSKGLRAASVVLDNPLVRGAAKLGGVGGTALLHTTELAPGTLTQAHVDALQRPYDGGVKPIDVSNPVASKDPGGTAASDLTHNQTLPTSERTGLRLNNRQQLSMQQDPRLLNADTARPELGASRDFTNEFEKGKLPADMREGVVYKTKQSNGVTAFSGRNIGGDSPLRMVDGMGRYLKTLDKPLVAAPGSVNMSPYGYAFTPSAATPEGRAAQKQEWDGKVAAMQARESQALRENQPDPMNQPMSKHKRAAMVQMRNAETQAASQKYTADQNYAAHELPLKYAEQQRKALAALYTGGGQGQPGEGGKPRSLGEMIQQGLAQGVDVKPLIDQHKAQLEAQQAAQTFGHNYTENARSILENQFGADAEGKAAAAAAFKHFMDVTKGQTLDETTLRAQLPNAVRHGKMITGLRKRDMDHNDSWAVALGFQDPRPLSTDLDPRTQLRKIGGLEGAWRGGGVSSGDYATTDGRFIPGDIDMDVPAYQEDRRKTAQGK